MGCTAGVSRGGSSFQSPEVHAHMQSRFAAAGEPGARRNVSRCFQAVASMSPVSRQWAPHQLPSGRSGVDLRSPEDQPEVWFHAFPVGSGASMQFSQGA